MDADGVAGGAVTVLLGTVEEPSILSVLAVQPGDVVTINDSIFPTAAFGTEATLLSLPPSPPAGTTQYLGYIGECSTTFTTVPTFFDHGGTECISAGGQFAALVEGATASYLDLGYAFAKNVPDSPDADADASTVPFVLSGGDGGWAPTQIKTVSATNLPQAGTATLSYSEVANGIRFFSNANYVALGPDAGTTSEPLPSHPEFPDFVQSEVHVFGLADGNATSLIATREDATAATGTTAFDLSTALPLITAVTFDATIPARPTVSWTTAGSVASADGAGARFTWAPGPSSDGHWTIYAPPTATSVQAPALPADAAAWAPPSTASFTSSPIVVVAETPLLSGYAQLRQNVGNFPVVEKIAEPDGSGWCPALPVDGTIRASAYQVQED